MKAHVIKLCTVALLWLASCGEQVSLQNQSGELLSDAQVQAGQKTVWSGSLPAGEQVKVRFRATGDGSFSVTGRLASGKPVSRQQLGYITPHDGQNHQIIVGTDGVVKYSRAR
jgi:hypothetical protein